MKGVLSNDVLSKLATPTVEAIAFNREEVTMIVKMDLAVNPGDISKLVADPELLAMGIVAGAIKQSGLKIVQPAVMRDASAILAGASVLGEIASICALCGELLPKSDDDECTLHRTEGMEEFLDRRIKEYYEDFIKVARPNGKSVSDSIAESIDVLFPDSPNHKRVTVTSLVATAPFTDEWMEIAGEPPKETSNLSEAQLCAITLLGILRGKEGLEAFDGLPLNRITKSATMLSWSLLGSELAAVQQLSAFVNDEAYKGLTGAYNIPMEEEFSKRRSDLECTLIDHIM
jgi:hypothetical protein